MQTEIIVAVITAATSIIGTVIFNSRKTKTVLQKEFELLVGANRNFRDEIREDLISARNRILTLERDLAIATVNITTLSKELDIAMITIAKLENELRGKNELIHVLTKAVK